MAAQEYPRLLTAWPKGCLYKGVGYNSRFLLEMKIRFSCFSFVHASDENTLAAVQIIMSSQASSSAVPQTNGVNGYTTKSSVDFDAIVIGAGFGGLRMLYELRKQGLRGKVFEAGSGVGGVRSPCSTKQVIFILEPLSYYCFLTLLSLNIANQVHANVTDLVLESISWR